MLFIYYIDDKLVYDCIGVKFEETLRHFYLTLNFYKVNTRLINYIFNPNNLVQTYNHQSRLKWHIAKKLVALTILNKINWIRLQINKIIGEEKY